MLPRDLGWRNYNVLRGEGRLLVRGSSGNTNGRSVSFNPREIEYRLLPLVHVKPDFVIPYVLCWRVPGAIHRIQINPSVVHHHHQQQQQQQQHQRQQPQHHYQQHRQRRRHFEGAPRTRPAPPPSTEHRFAYGAQRDILADSGMETRVERIVANRNEDTSR
ncbi:uncharacterized protein LOC112463496 [Temnothorax curvispinosus]|uniref:Uncharacterized protein LOC112463496 n=1 Tax=Temnothorax curvispinosus TaxID=300111 RepID=A0A6J1QT88_9HYME|nr:uncharacterized protein LOC112463496 [Temnothorax curvispinosus]